MQSYYTSAARQSQGQLQHLIERLAHERDVLAQRFNHAQQQLVILKQQQQQQQEQSAYVLAQAHQQLQSLAAQNQSLRDELTAREAQARPEPTPPAVAQALNAPVKDDEVAAPLITSSLAELIALRDQLDAALAMSQDPENPWHQGIAHLLTQFDASLERQGLSRFARPGDDFDPNIHEAIATDHAKDMSAGKLLRVIKPGFSFKRDGALARTAQVVVSR